jgi:hypothetical protein
MPGASLPGDGGGGEDRIESEAIPSRGNLAEALICLKSDRALADIRDFGSDWLVARDAVSHNGPSG